MKIVPIDKFYCSFSYPIPFLLSTRNSNQTTLDVLALVLSEMEVSHWECGTPTYYLSVDFIKQIAPHWLKIESWSSIESEQFTFRGVDKQIFEVVNFDGGLWVKPNADLREAFLSSGVILNLPSYLQISSISGKKLFGLLNHFLDRKREPAFPVGVLKQFLCINAESPLINNTVHQAIQSIEDHQSHGVQLVFDKLPGFTRDGDIIHFHYKRLEAGKKASNAKMDMLSIKYLPYHEYLLTDHWNSMRIAAIERARHRCQVCNSRDNLEVHHRTYIRRGHERDDDLTVLCHDCHDLFHKHNRGELSSGKDAVPIVSD